LLASLRAFRNVNGRFATERGHINFAAEGRFAKADRDRAMQVIAIALKDFVFLEANFNVQITRRAPIGAWLAVARAANSHAVVDTRRNFDFECFLFFKFALATARRAGIGDDFAGTAAMRTRLLHAEKALAHLYRARALTSAAGFGAGAFLGTRTTAGVALIPARNSNLGIFSSRCLFQSDFHGIA